MTNYGPQLHLGGKPTPNNLKPVRNHEFLPKPKGGLWTSSLVEITSEWEVWCEANGYGKPNYDKRWVLIPNEDAKILHINSAQQLDQYVSLFPPETLKGINFDLINSFCRMHLFNWIEIAKVYDAVHITKPRSMGLSTWDVESTVWFRWKFNAVHNICDYLGDLNANRPKGSRKKKAYQ